MEMDKVYNPKAIEGELYREWEESGAFTAHREEGKKPSEVMNEYAKMMYDLGKFERNIREMVSEARRNPELSDDDVIDFLEAANKLREERGLPPFKIPSLAKRGLMLAHRAERLRSTGNGE